MISACRRDRDDQRSGRAGHRRARDVSARRPGAAAGRRQLDRVADDGRSRRRDGTGSIWSMRQAARDAGPSCRPAGRLSAAGRARRSGSGGGPGVDRRWAGLGKPGRLRARDGRRICDARGDPAPCRSDQSHGERDRRRRFFPARSDPRIVRRVRSTRPHDQPMLDQIERLSRAFGTHRTLSPTTCERLSPNCARGWKICSSNGRRPRRHSTESTRGRRSRPDHGHFQRAAAAGGDRFRRASLCIPQRRPVGNVDRNSRAVWTECRRKRGDACRRRAKRN